LTGLQQLKRGTIRNFETSVSDTSILLFVEYNKIYQIFLTMVNNIQNNYTKANKAEIGTWPIFILSLGSLSENLHFPFFFSLPIEFLLMK
jgi:hypothetical protein